MTAADLQPILTVLMSQYAVLWVMFVFLLLITILEIIRFCVVMKRSVKGRMDHV